MSGIGTLILVAAAMFCVLGGITLLAHIYNLNNIKSKTVGDGQHGTARWATANVPNTMLKIIIPPLLMPPPSAEYKKKWQDETENERQSRSAQKPNKVNIQANMRLRNC